MSQICGSVVFLVIALSSFHYPVSLLCARAELCRCLAIEETGEDQKIRVPFEASRQDEDNGTTRHRVREDPEALVLNDSIYECI